MSFFLEIKVGWRYCCVLPLCPPNKTQEKKTIFPLKFPGSFWKTNHTFLSGASFYFHTLTVLPGVVLGNAILTLNVSSEVDIEEKIVGRLIIDVICSSASFWTVHPPNSLLPEEKKKFYANTLP